MQDAKTKVSSKWYSCQCGIVWQKDFPTKVYGKKYWEEYSIHDNKLKDTFQYPVRIYSPIIEELIYGRRVLLIGRVNTHQEDAFKTRGWVPTSIDINKEQWNPPDIVGDFQEFEFPAESKFDMIWMYHSLECFKDPLYVLAKCKSLLTEDGIIALYGPDTDFIHTRGSSGFIHWKPDMNYMMWNRRAITGHLEKLGFQIIVARQNYEHRFPYWDDYHIIAQVKFF